MYLNDSEEFIALIIAIGLVVGLLYKSYTDYHKMTKEHNKKVLEKTKNEEYIKALTKQLEIKNELLKKVIELKNKKKK
ncbi:MAG: hypothetical protein CMC40_03305 [Flavobacteriaceae bacterium]|nr:hypothetical protein [Flavobacteriaceae bacterium]|tara:strand:+ start:1349 stop:1582 length:234 start_codon:yes stop_codon:yes gene_type:complete